MFFSVRWWWPSTKKVTSSVRFEWEQWRLRRSETSLPVGTDRRVLVVSYTGRRFVQFFTVKSNKTELKLALSSFYAPWRSGGGILVWACLCIHPSVRYTFIQSKQLEIGSWNLIYGMRMINKWTHIFFFLFRQTCCRVMPLFRTLFGLLHYKPMEPYQQNNWRTTWARIMSFGPQIVSKV